MCFLHCYYLYLFLYNMRMMFRPILSKGTIHAAANSGCMVASAHGTVIPDDVVSDADTEVALLHRRHQVLLPSWLCYLHWQ